MEYKRIEGKTPSGGDYSEIWYIDKNGNVVDEDAATNCIVNECQNDGRIVATTRAIINN